MSSDASPVVWITGAGGGLGKCLTTAFSESGRQVVASYHQHPVESSSPNVLPMRVDVTSGEEVVAAAREIQRRWGRLDVLVNNAGVTRDSLMAQMTADDWDGTMDVNLRGAFLCSREASKLMLRQGSGHIVNMSSFAAKRGHAGQANYVASKAGLIGLTQSLALELGSRNIQVNAVMPGVMATRMTAGMSDSQKKALAEANALGRWNDAAEVARFVQFLATMRNVSGQVFQLDSRIGAWT
ncbi:MAG: SDR family oxidoreductase [Verrucomicrobia bacterium]|nr:SDR family oxidoreductase [Verrucomicrobiota bacterium]MBI3867104.1 SDR family oxidoreductase [Verrucomicrobiota bacterium]